MLMEKNEKYYVIEKKGTLEKLAYSEIFYLRKEGKNVVFVHRSGETGIRASLSSLEEQLASDGYHGRQRISCQYPARHEDEKP